MEELGVYNSEDEELLGRFLNVTESNDGVKVWYTTKNGMVRSCRRENCLVKEIFGYGPA